jgi:hypothetical protein
MTRNALAVLLGFILMTLSMLTGCGQPASCWNSDRGRFTSCEDMRRDEIDRRIDEREHRR